MEADTPSSEKDEACVVKGASGGNGHTQVAGLGAEADTPWAAKDEACVVKGASGGNWHAQVAGLGAEADSPRAEKDEVRLGNGAFGGSRHAQIAGLGAEADGHATEKRGASGAEVLEGLETLLQQHRVQLVQLIRLGGLHEAAAPPRPAASVARGGGRAPSPPRGSRATIPDISRCKLSASGSLVPDQGDGRAPGGPCPTSSGGSSRVSFDMPEKSGTAALARPGGHRVASSCSSRVSFELPEESTAAAPTRNGRPSGSGTESPAAAGTRRSCANTEVGQTVSFCDMAAATESGSEVTRLSTFSAFEKVRRVYTLRTGTSSNLNDIENESMTSSAVGFLASVKRRIQRATASNVFEMLVAVLIVSNAAFCGIEVEYMAQARIGESTHEFQHVSLAYACVFTLELLVRLIAEDLRFFWPLNMWNLLDSVIVLTSWLEVGLDMGSSGAGQLPSIRIIRMTKIVRVLRMARIMRHFRSLRILIYSVMNTIRSLFWTMVLLAIILYMFSILFTQAATHHLVLEDSPTIPGLESSYGSLARSVFTLFQAISGGVSWKEVVRPLSDLHGMWMFCFLVYFSFTYFAVLNVVTGVFCQTAIESASRDQEMAAQAQIASTQRYVKQLKSIFRAINTNSSGKITLKDLDDYMQDEKVKAYFASIDLSCDEAYSLFKLLDREQTLLLDIDTFVTGCLKLRGAAKQLDIAMMMYETRWTLQKCIDHVKSLEERFEEAFQGFSTVQSTCKSVEEFSEFAI